MAEFRFTDLAGVGADMHRMAWFHDAVTLSTDDTLRFRAGDATISYSGDFGLRRGAVTGTVDGAKVKRDGATVFTVTDLDLDAGALWALAVAEHGDEALRLVTAGDDWIFGTRFTDLLFGGGGRDAIRGGGGKDRIEGGGRADRLYGEVGDDRIDGGAGNDRLFGGDDDDRLIGGAGDDVLHGSAGRDLLYGGDGADRFVFADRLDFALRAAPDELRDFSRGEDDRIDLSALDANTLRSGEQAFRFIGRNGFSETAGELRFKNGVLSGDVQGDGGADFHIAVDDVARLSTSDFLL